MIEESIIIQTKGDGLITKRNKSSKNSISDLNEDKFNSTLKYHFEIELRRNRIPFSSSQYIIHKFEKEPCFVIPKYKIAIYCSKKTDSSYNTKLKNQNSNQNVKVTNDEKEKIWKEIWFSESEMKQSLQECLSSITNEIKYQNENLTDYKFTYIDLFSGIGGFRSPLDSLGGKCIGYSEINKKSIETYKLNFDKYPIEDEQYLGDITKVDKKLETDIDLIVGGVPCQAWSVAGKMKGFEDPRGKLWQDAIRMVSLNNPKAFIFENVKGLADPRNKANLDLIITELKSIGYEVPKPQLLNSFDFGVPQNRDRIFIVGFRKDLKSISKFSYPEPLGLKPKLTDILDDINPSKIFKEKFDLDRIHGEKIPFSRNRFQKLDELNDFFVFCDTRNGHSTIHSWDIIKTSKKEKEICLTILKNRRKKIYGIKDGNPLSYSDLEKLIKKLNLTELEQLVEKKILKKVEDKYEFQNSKNSAGINGIYRIYLPSSDIFSTLTATGTKDMIAFENIEGKDAKDYKLNFINKIYKKNKFRPITGIEAGKLQGFPSNFAIHPNETIAKKQFGNAVSAPVICNLTLKLIQTGVFE